MTIFGKTKSGFLILLTSCILLSACQTSGTYPSYLTLTLHHDVIVPAQSSQAYIQYGEVKKHSAINESEPYCQLYAPRPRDAADLTISAAVFEVRRVYRRKHLVSLSPLLVATGLSGIHDLSKHTLSTHIELFSINQPLVKELICSRWADDLPWNYLSPVDISEALGMLATIETSQ